MREGWTEAVEVWGGLRMGAGGRVSLWVARRVLGETVGSLLGGDLTRFPAVRVLGWGCERPSGVPHRWRGDVGECEGVDARPEKRDETTPERLWP